MVASIDGKHPDSIACVILIPHQHDDECVGLYFTELEYKHILFELAQLDELRLGEEFPGLGSYFEPIDDLGLLGKRQQVESELDLL